ncbi:type II and III secretion system protein family protein [uncultured Aliiroseovarius sp.]|uniref:type II and III secretion system protein family protein n=1 Tax=uncultured Aliiroseovarius sp. TaxID=1658783 RepID=UPI002622C53A|nr:type II and III secretion system protein family protein [uncultured Aliiroseovarius sp.]
MKIDHFIKAALLGLSLGVGSAPVAGFSETLRVTDTGPSRPLTVPMNRAVVVESDTPFAELSIANPGIADISTLSDRTIYVLGKAPGRTTLTLLGPDGKLLSNVEVHVTPDISEFKERLRQILPSEGIEVRTANDGIVLSGIVSSPQQIALALDLANRYAPGRVSNMMNVGGTQQVMLKVRFAEMNRSVRKALSTSLAFSGGNSTTSPQGATGVGISQGASLLDTTQTTTIGDSQGAFKIGFGAGSLQVGILLEALESKGVVRTLAEPNLTALSGQEASFLAGGEYPIPVKDDDGVAIDYKPIGVELNFTPTVLNDDVINLQVKGAVSGVEGLVNVGNGYDAVTFRRRETSTTVELRDGESFAIAGLIEDDFRDSIGSVPWLGDLPVLGALFRSTEYERRLSELVIIVSAHLVTPTRGEFLAVPTDRIRPPSEKGLFLFGKTAKATSPTTGVAAEIAKQDFSGSYGYVME